MSLEKFDAIIIDSDMSSKVRLKQATSSVPNFGKVQLLGTLRETIAKLELGDRCDVIFISHAFETQEITPFIQSAKALPAAQDAAYILVLKSADQDSSTVAQNVMMGADGLLFEPYSVDQLVEITRLAARVRKERTAAREEAALKFLVTDIMNQIDLIAYMRSSGYEVGRHIRKFKDICSVFGTLSPDSMQSYLRIATDMFEHAPLPKKVYQRKQYAGASSRVKKKMEEKLLAELEKGAPAPKA